MTYLHGALADAHDGAALNDKRLLALNTHNLGAMLCLDLKTSDPITRTSPHSTHWEKHDCALEPAVNAAERTRKNQSTTQSLAQTRRPGSGGCMHAPKLDRHRKDHGHQLGGCINERL